MKHTFFSKWLKTGVIALLTAALGLSALAFLPTAVFAQTPTPNAPQSSPADKAAKRAQRLENAFSRENQWLSTQATNLQRMGQIASKGQDLIDKAKAKGFDVSALQSALNTFKSQIPTAQGLHDKASGILSTHSGFDANGKVTDAAAATQTVKDARQNLGDAHRTMRTAAVDLRGAIRTFRSEHKGQLKSTPAPTATPGSNS